MTHSLHTHHEAAQSITLFSPSGVVAKGAMLRLAARRLTKMGFETTLDESALMRHQRFAGDDDTRLSALHRVARADTDIVMPGRGGYGLTRLLDRIDWKLIARSISRGTRWVGYSDFTALQLASLAHKAGNMVAGPMACDDFGRSEEHGGVDDVTQACFLEAMHGELEAVGFRTEPGHHGLEVRGTLWGGNLAMVQSLLGTPHWPRIKGGILFLEDVNVHPYAIERMLLQLHQAGVLDAQKAIVLGAFTEFRKSPLDRGYTLKTMVQTVRAATRTPVLTGLPFGHVHPKVTMPVGERVMLLVEGRDAFIVWG